MLTTAVGWPQTLLAQTPTPTPAPALVIDKTVSGNLVDFESGGPVQYTLAYSCASALVDCLDPVIIDRLPPGFEFVDLVGTSDVSNITYDEATRTLRIELDTDPDPAINALNAGRSGILRLNTNVQPGLLPGTQSTNVVTMTATNATSTSDAAPTINVTGQFEMTARKTMIGEAIVGRPITFELAVCSPDTVGGVPFTDAVMVDTIPAGATFVGAQGVQGVDWTYDPATRQLTFLTLPNPIPVGGCVTRTMQISYPTEINNQTNQLAITGTPQGCANPANRPSYCGGQGARTLTDSITFGVVPAFPRLAVDKRADSRSSFEGVEARAGDPVTYTIAVTNTGYVTLTNAALTETIPAQMVLDSFLVTPYANGPVNLFFRQSGAPNSWVPAPGNPYTNTTSLTPAALGIPAGQRVTDLAWQLGPMPEGFSYSTRLFLRVGTTTPVNSVITNCAGGVGLVGATQIDGRDCVDLTTVLNRAIPRPKKEANIAGQVLPGSEITFTISMDNEPQAHLPVINPVVADLLPPQFEYLPGTLQVVSPAAGVPAPLLEVIPNYGGTGRTLLRASWTGASAYSLPPGESLLIAYGIRVRDDTPPGRYLNRAVLASFDNPTADVLRCTGTERYVDANDLDGDGNRTEVSCQSPTTQGGARVGVTLSIDSRKTVRGFFDTDYTRFGRTTEGATANYRLTLTNTSNVSITNISIVDIFPYIGDRGVIDPSARQSTWRPNLIGPVTAADPATPLTVYYSASQNPCRPQMIPSGPPGCVDDWSRDFPIDPDTDLPDPVLVQAIRLDFCTYNSAGVATACLTLPRNTANVIEWPMLAPAGAPEDTDCAVNPPGPNCQIAWNSFGVAATGGGLRFRPTEPLRVGIGVQPSPDFALGDFVWLDVAGIENDGVQQSVEPGINGVLVELYNAATNALERSVLTGNDQQNRPGYYLFPGLSAGAYYLRFYPPAGFTASPPDRGGNDALDSDWVISNTVNLTTTYYQTENITLTLTSPANDLTWDFGMDRITDYGDAPWDGVNYFYPTRAISLTNPALAARHIIASTVRVYRFGACRDQELDGQPTLTAFGDDANNTQVPACPDDEDGITLPAAVPGVSSSGSSGVLVRGVANTITAVVYAPVGQTSYINAFIDFNADGDWDDSGERIASNVAVAGAGATPVNINLPVTPAAGAALGTTYARFRLSSVQGLLPTGTAPDGEVEDYRLQIIDVPLKSIIATSEPHTTGNNPTIGEIVRYRLRAAIPEGVVPNVRFADTLQSGLQYIAGSAVFSSTSNSGLVIQNNPPVITTPAAGPVFDFGTVTNNDFDEGLEYLYVDFSALVVNSTANQAGQTRTNTFTFSYTGFSRASNTVSVTLVEPVVTLGKTIVAPAPSDAGDLITYRIVAQQTTGSNRADAYNVVISDTVDSGLTLETVTIGGTSGISITNATAGSLVTVRAERIRIGESVIVTVTARVNNLATAGTIIPNAGTVTWTSLPGPIGTTPNSTGSTTPGTPGAATGERIGTATTGLNDYMARANVSTTLAQPAVDKREPVPATYTIGEPLTYTLLVTLPEGTTPNLIVTDTLPAGLGYLSMQVVTSAADSGGLLDADYGGTLPTPTLLTTAGDGNDIRWSFGNVINPGDNTTTNNSFLLRLRVVVQNVIANQRGTMLDNIGRLSYTNPNTGATTTLSDDPVRITLVEPVLQIAKTVAGATPRPDAGDPVTYTITLNHAATSARTAYNVSLTDTLPAVLRDASIVRVTATDVSTPTAAINGSTVRVPDTGTFDLPQGATVTLVVAATLADNAEPGTVVPNRTGAIWTSMPDSPADERTSGPLVPDGAELLDSGALNDYEVNASAQFTPADAVTVRKELYASSAAHTPNADITIGEVITYRIPITLSEGTIPSFRLVDNVPAGLAYIGGLRVVSDTLNGTVPAPTVTPAGAGGSGDDVTIDFGAITVVGDNVATNNTFAVLLPLRMLDLPTTSGVAPQSQFVNTAQWRVGTAALTPTNSVTITAVEPRFAIAKVIEPPIAAANDLVTVTLVVTNTGTSDAFEATLADPLPAGLLYAGELASTAGLAPDTLGESANVINAFWAQFPEGASSTLTFQARLEADVELNDVITNTATIRNGTTLPGTDPNERTEPSVDASDSVRVIVPDLTLVKDDSLLEVVPGRALPYRLTVRNVGERGANGVVITETVPANTRFVAAGSPGWVDTAGAPCADNAAPGTVCRYLVGDLAAGASTAVTFTVRIDNPLSLSVETVTNSAIVGDDGSHGPDPTPENNEDDDVDTLVGAQLGDYVWEDVDGDGSQDAGEPAIPNVTVRLYRASDPTTVLLTTTTDANGVYTFTNLVPADYIVEFVPPTGYRITTRDTAGDTIDSDADQTTGRTAVITLPPRTVNSTIDAGLYRPAGLGDFVWLDRDPNGIEEAGEEGIVGITVNLYRTGETAVYSTTTTGPGGAYSFQGLPPGSYVVEIVRPPDYRITLPNVGDDALDSDIAGNGRTAPIILDSGEYDPTIDGGLYQPAAVGDFVWTDTNANGVQDPGETGLGGVTVTLYSADDPTTPISTTQTAADGSYLFSNLPPGDYILQFTPPAGYRSSPVNIGDDAADSDADPITGRTAAVTLANGATVRTVDAGLYQPASLGDRVWVDTDGNGIQDGGEPGLNGVRVDLYRAGESTPFTTTTTAGDGTYGFTNLVPGDYVVQFVLPGLSVFTLPNVGDDAGDSDADPASGRTPTITLSSGESDQTWDAGTYIMPNVGDFVWNDTDGDGIQEAGEAGVPGVTVNLYRAGETTPLSTTTTLADGFYGFYDLPPGNYFVEFIRPAGYAFSPIDGGDDALDSDANLLTGRTVQFLLPSGENILTIDAGIYRPSITLVKFTNGEDADLPPGPTISERSPVTWTYVISNTGSVVLVDLTLDDNPLGPVTCPVQSLQPGEGTICTANGLAVLGQYVNTGTVSAQSPDGTQIVTATNPSHYFGVERTITLTATATCFNDAPYVSYTVSNLNFTPDSSTPVTLTWETTAGRIAEIIIDQPFSRTDVLWPGASVDPVTGQANGWPGWTEVAPGEFVSVTTDLRPQMRLIATVNPTATVLLDYPPADPYCVAAPRSSLGDYVWNDTDGDGVQDAGEPGIANVTVRLYRAGETTPLSTTVTAADGSYLFPRLIPGDYEVEFVRPDGMRFTIQSGGDSALDSNADRTTGRTGVIPLAEGEQQRTIDAGLYTASLALKKYTNGFDADTPPGPEILINTPVTWTYVVTNTGTVSLTNVSVTDDQGVVVTCPLTTLIPNQSMTCSATGSAALGQYANIGTVTAFPANTEETLDASDPSHYIGIDPLPSIVVSKTADRTFVPWPGGAVTFTVVVTNTSINDVVILTTLTDSIYGDLNGQGSCSMPQTLALGGVYTCRFSVTITISPDSPGDLVETNVVTARGTGEKQEPVEDDDDETVSVPCVGRSVTGIVYHDVNSNGQLDPGEQPFVTDGSIPAGDRIDHMITLEKNDPSIAIEDRTLLTLTQNGRFRFETLDPTSLYTFRVADESLQSLDYLPTTSSLVTDVRPRNCAPVEINIGYAKGQAMVGDFFWYDVTRDGEENEWFDANDDNTITANATAAGFTLADFEFVDLNANGVADLVGELNECGINSTGPVVTLITPNNAANRTAIVGNTGYYRFRTDGNDVPLSPTGTYTVTRNPTDPKLIESAVYYAGNGNCKSLTVASNQGVAQFTPPSPTATAEAVARTNQALVLGGIRVEVDGQAFICGDTTPDSLTTDLSTKAVPIDLTLDYGVVCAAATAGLGDYVWLDANRNGVQDSGEAPIPNVTVRLYINGFFDTPLRTTRTDANGFYRFDGLMPSNYVVEFVRPDTRLFTRADLGGDINLDSDVNPTTGRTPPITLGEGQYQPDWDAGIAPLPTADPEDPEPDSYFKVFLPSVQQP